MALRFLLRSSLKVGIAGGAVYVTYREGVWGDANQSMAAYERLVNHLPDTKPYTDKLNINQSIVGYIKKPFVVRPIGEYWNKGVIYTFAGLAAAPKTIAEYSSMAARKTVDAINNSLK